MTLHNDHDHDEYDDDHHHHHHHEYDDIQYYTSHSSFVIFDTLYAL
jgi:hypothetical protein